MRTLKTAFGHNGINYIGLLAGAVLLSCSRLLCSAELLLNGGFESGNLNGWTTFTTSNGNLGTASGCPKVSPFDVDGDGLTSPAAVFQVGENTYISSAGHTFEGGGVFQSFSATAGAYDISLKLAVQNPSSLPNDTAGVCTLFLDGVNVASVDFKALIGGNNISPGQIERASFALQRSLSSGTHEVRLLITRNWLTSSDTPFEYLDDFSVAAVPEPSCSLLIAGGLLGWVMVKRSRRCGLSPDLLSRS